MGIEINTDEPGLYYSTIHYFPFIRSEIIRIYEVINHIFAIELQTTNFHFDLLLCHFTRKCLRQKYQMKARLSNMFN